MKNIILPIVASVSVLASNCTYATPSNTGAPTTFVHLFEWSWPDVAKEL
ncbi:hypothetical protein [Pseudoalteromonas luteoviolacea]|nr:hypothetical protein [Pseudoalteromonas luteoviolacea]